MFVVPSVVDAVSRSAREIIDEAVEQYHEYDGDIEGAAPWEESPPVDFFNPAPLGSPAAEPSAPSREVERNAPSALESR
jgi:hypothetical protein